MNDANGGHQGPWWKQRRFIAWAILVALAAASIGGLIAALTDDEPGHEWALTFSSALMFAALALVRWIGGDKGLLSPLIGADNRVSTSRVTTGLWTVAVGYGIAYLLGLVVFDDQEVAHLIDNGQLDNYLLLLGGPFAALVAAKGIVAAKVESGDIQKIDAAEPVLADAATDDNGRTDLVDLQYLVFNVVAIGYFAWQTGRNSILPEMPSPLVGLTLVGAATYLGNKMVEKEVAGITSLAPQTGVAGGQLVIHGNNLVVGDAELGSEMSVELVGYGKLIDVDKEQATAGRVEITLPGDLPAGDYQVIVTTNAGNRTAATGDAAKLVVP